MYRINNCKNDRKCINIRSERVYNKLAKDCQYGGERAQMLIMGAILIAATIIAFSVVVGELSNIPVQLPVQKSSSLFPVFEDIRDKFGYALDDLLDANSSIESINNYFNATRDSFSKIQAQHMQYFDAELLNVSYYSDYIDIKAKLSLHNDFSMINEEVVFKIK